MERRVIFFEDVREGGEVPPFMVERLTRMDLVRYAGASGDFNPIHTDEEFARAAGNPSVFGHGMLTAAFVGKCVTDYVGSENLRRFKVRFATRVWPGQHHLQGQGHQEVRARSEERRVGKESRTGRWRSDE